MKPAALAAMALIGTALLLPVAAAGQIEVQIVGAWEWSETGCDHGAFVFTPETEGYTEQAVFGSADAGYQYRRYRNSVLTDRGSYAILHVGTILHGVVVDVLDITVGDETTRYTVGVNGGPEAGSGGLQISDGLCDHAWISRGPVSSDRSTWSAVKAQYR